MNSEKDIQKVVVVIPIHSPSPSAYELISFKQCFTILGSHPIKILAPKGLDIARYQDVVPEFETIFIDASWQSSITKYNKLKTSRFFYGLFKEYQFLLTYELDAFIFRDDLLLWCSKNYDYIGAPWFEDYIQEGLSNKLIGVGNSGFSLRKIGPILELLKRIYYKNPLEYNSGKLGMLKLYTKKPFRWLMHHYNNALGENYTVQNNFPYYEDIFFGTVAPIYAKDFKVASVEEAMRFSFELKPALLYERTNGELPMGCHAWWRYAFDFWKPHIEKFGYVL
jgi:hypothetical protein